MYKIKAEGKEYYSDTLVYVKKAPNGCYVPCLAEEAEYVVGKVPEDTIFENIDVGHAGTIDNPIPAARGMEYEYGKYYLDPEDEKTYLCKRGEETGSIVLYYLPHELIGQYFEEVS